MNKIIILSIVVLGLMFISSCSKGVIDCGTDTACFTKNFRTCTPSRIYGGLTEVKGGTPKSCQVYLQSQENPKYTGGKVLSMECTVQNTDTFKDDAINMLGIMDKSSSCSGTLYDEMNKLLQSSKGIQNK